VELCFTFVLQLLYLIFVLAAAKVQSVVVSANASVKDSGRGDIHVVERTSSVESPSTREPPIQV
jgi:hypothetical protein